MTVQPESIEDLQGMAKAHAPVLSRLKAAARLWVSNRTAGLTFIEVADVGNVPLDTLAIFVNFEHERRQREAS